MVRPILVLSGASGSGKTAIAREVERRLGNKAAVYFFDSIEIPSESEMVARSGSGENWQREATIEWLRKLASLDHGDRAVLFEGQMRLAFVREGAAAAGIAVVPLLVHCNDEARERRLIELRGQPELANAEMRNWAAYLRREAQAAGLDVLDTSTLSLDEAVGVVIEKLKAL